MNTLWASAARFARDLGPSALRAFGLSQVGFGLILRLYTKYSLPLYTQGDCSLELPVVQNMGVHFATLSFIEVPVVC